MSELLAKAIWEALRVDRPRTVSFTASLELDALCVTVENPFVRLCVEEAVLWEDLRCALSPEVLLAEAVRGCARELNDPALPAETNRKSTS